MNLRLGGRRWRRRQKQLWELLRKVKVAEMTTGRPNPAVVLSHCYPSSSLAQCHHRSRCSSPSPPTTHAAVVAVAAAFFSTYTSSITAPVLLPTIVRFLRCILLGYRRQIGYPYADNLVAPKSYYIFVVNSCP
ncbi:hypothetical protein BHM03_00013244 [Ensete ventricosum]|nr:hypothetical protein BHM03_00013244 [Ensete ventricosum]